MYLKRSVVFREYLFERFPTYPQTLLVGGGSLLKAEEQFYACKYFYMDVTGEMLLRKACFTFFIKRQKTS